MPRVALPPTARAVVYYVTLIIGLLLASWGAWYQVTDDTPPDIYLFAVMIWPLWTAAFGGIAATNTLLKARPVAVDHGQPGDHRIHEVNANRTDTTAERELRE